MCCTGWTDRYTELMSNSTFNHDNSSGDALQDSGMSRRKIIKYGGLAAGVVVATPTILTLGATPASASGTAAFKFSQVDDTISNQSTQTIGAAGLWVVAFAVKGFNASGTNTATINTPTGWTQIGSQWGSISLGASSRLTMALFYRYYDTSPGNTNTVTFSHTGSTAFPRGYAGYNFPRATVANSNFGGTSFSGNNSASVSSVTTVAAQSKYLFLSVGAGTGTPGFTNPTGYTGTSNNITSMGMTAMVSSAYAGASGSTSGDVTGTWTNTTSGTVANRLAAIIAIG